MPDWHWQRFPACDDTTATLLQKWSTDGPSATAETLKPGKVWAISGVVVKSAPAYRLRRAATGVARVAPLAAPEPLMLGVRGGEGLLAMRRCPGVRLDDAWDDPAARDGLADLIASLLRRRLVHGDLSPDNLLWDGERLWLLDLDGLRNPLHGLLWRRQLRRQWAWFLDTLPNDVRIRAAYDRSCTALGLTDVERRWRAVRRLALVYRSCSRNPPPRKSIGSAPR